MTSPKDTPMSEIELLACPFCGGEAELYENHAGEVYSAWCADRNECAVHPDTDNYSTEAEAIAAWNQRHTTPSDPVLRWEGSELWLGDEPVAWVDTFKSGQAEWNCTLANFEGDAPALPEAKTAAEQAVRDWLARAGLVRQGGEPVACSHEAYTVDSAGQIGKCVDCGTFLDAYPPASPTAKVVEALAELQLAAFLAVRGSIVTKTEGRTRQSKPGPTMDDYRNMARAALAKASS